jgi:signal transduction histidine kinase
VPPQSDRIRRTLLHQVADRLQRNQQSCQLWKSWIISIEESSTTTGTPTATPTINATTKSPVIRTMNFHQPVWHRPALQPKHPDVQPILSIVDHLHTIHDNTHRLCQTVLDMWSQKIDAEDDTVSLSSPMSRDITATFQEIASRHEHTIEHVARLAMAVRLYESTLSTPHLSLLETTLAHFLHVRFSMLLLCDVHARLVKNTALLTATSSTSMPSSSVWVSSSNTTLLASLLHEASLEAALIAEAHGCTAVPVFILLDESASNGVEALLVQSWFMYVLVELIKNALIATWRQQQQHSLEERPMYIVMTRSNLSVYDQGGGLPSLPQQEEDPFVFAQAHRLWDRLDDQQTYAAVRSPMQGLGVGLYLSRLLLRHFGGTVRLESRSRLIVLDTTSCTAPMTGDAWEESSIVLEPGCTAVMEWGSGMDTPEYLPDFPELCEKEQ